MNELINITKTTINDEEVNAVNARDLHEKLGVKRDFSNWIKDRLEGFTEGQDYALAKIGECFETGKGGKTRKIDYIISLDVAKHIAMLERNEQGRKIRQYFIEVEKQYRKKETEKLPTPEVLMATLCTEMERRIKAESERDEYRRNLQRIALASGLDYGAISETTGLPKDIVIPTYCRSSKREHAPQSARFIQLILPLREIIHELRIENNA